MGKKIDVEPAFPAHHDYSVHFRSSKFDDGVCVAICDSLELATAVALQFHQLSNTLHVVSVSYLGEDLVVLSRFKLVAYPKQQGNAR